MTSRKYNLRELFGNSATANRESAIRQGLPYELSAREMDKFISLSPEEALTAAITIGDLRVAEGILRKYRSIQQGVLDRLVTDAAEKGELQAARLLARYGAIV